MEVYHVAMPLIYPWRTAYGEDYDIHSVLVKAFSGDIEAWSESTPLRTPTYLSESAISVFNNVTNFFGPHVIGREYDTADALNERLKLFKGNSFAKAAIEICWWTLQSRITKTPIHKLLGGKTRPVSAGADFGIQDSYEMLLGNIQAAVDQGFPRIKLKVARGWDIEMLKVVRGTFPDVIFHIDCNAGYTMEDLPFFKAIDDLELAFIEQPLSHLDILDHAELARLIQTPICLDESVLSPDIVEQAIRVGACKYVNIKPGRVGGLANSKAIHDLCWNSGIPVWVGGMLESALGSALCVEVATLPNFTYPGDLFESSRFYTNDLSSPTHELTPEKTFKPFGSELPTPNPDLLDKFTVQSQMVS